MRPIMTRLRPIPPAVFPARGFFELLSAQDMEIVRTKDMGTPQYDIYSGRISPSASSTSGTATPRRSSSTPRISAT
jgi:hypothetical protein